MATLMRRSIFPLLALLALGSVWVLPGCDWLTSSDNVQRRSPFISDLKITPSSVFCNAQFLVSFTYDDPQGDIARAVISRRLEGAAAAIETTEPWPDDINQNVGRASFPLTFSCDSNGGQYEITVSAEDDGGHRSNALSGVIFLNKAG